jgi:polyisoprenoid-binding protein YceI
VSLRDAVAGRYLIGGGSALRVIARSRVHDTTTVWKKLSGTIEVDADQLERAVARVAVDMTDFDTGDWLKNRKLRSDFDFDAYPTASFELRGLRDVRRDGQRFSAVASGVLRWRGREVPIEVSGSGAITAGAVEATGAFEFNITAVGLKAPRVLMFKVDEDVRIEVVLQARAEAAA